MHTAPDALSCAASAASRGHRLARTSLPAVISLCVAVSSASVGCFGTRAARAPARSREIPIEAALFDRYGELERTQPTGPLPVLPEPKHIRSCCAFGLDLSMSVSGMRLPLYRYRTIRDLEDLGPHEYAAGLLQFTPSPVADVRRRPLMENNGIVYTCRGGFLDLGHLRDHADRTMFFTPRIEAMLDEGGTIELEEFGGKRRAVLQPVPRRRIEAIGRRRLAVAMAQWIAMQVSIWHEIGSWYGNSNVPFFPEKLSSFSMEDIYSNLVGTKLAAGIILTRSPADEVEFDRAMTQWLPVALSRLGIVSKDNASEAMRAVDGIWWDSEKSMPDWTIVRRRKLDVGSPLRPWLVSMAYEPRAAPSLGCPSSTKPLALRKPEEVAGVRFAKYAAFEVDVNDNLAGNGFPFPRAGSRRITQADFPYIADRVRRELAAALVGPADHPRR